MSRAPHDDITRALPGDDNAALRRTLRSRLRRLSEALPEGMSVLVTAEGFTIGEAAKAREVEG